MLRRDVLKSLLALGAAPAVGELLPPLAVTGTAVAQPASARRFIDAHCHFFNAADIPIRGFLERVVFQDYPTTTLPSPRSSLLPSLDLSVFRGMVATLADFLLRSNAPTPATGAAMPDAAGILRRFQRSAAGRHARSGRVGGAVRGG